MLRPESKPGSFSAQPDQHGAYALNGVPAGRAVISVFGPHLQFDRTVDVPADQDLTLDLVFPTGARLSGRITKGGKPVAGRSVWMRPAEDKSDTLYQAMTQADGSYEIEGLPPGDYRLRADEDISRLVGIAGDAVLNIDIPSVQLAVRVLEDGGAVPIVGAKAYVRGSEPATARVDLWMPLNREDICHVPAALAGTTFHIGRFSGEPIVFEEWDGQSFDLP
jgi:hypothetical protein